jgi:hypothetical protein
MTIGPNRRQSIDRAHQIRQSEMGIAVQRERDCRMAGEGLVGFRMNAGAGQDGIELVAQRVKIEDLAVFILIWASRFEVDPQHPGGLPIPRPGPQPSRPSRQATGT